jgi:hypothetical protein
VAVARIQVRAPIELRRAWRDVDESEGGVGGGEGREEWAWIAARFALLPQREYTGDVESGLSTTDVH